MKKKIENKIAAMRNSDKKGMEVLGWILTIVLTIAVVGIIWFFVQPAVDSAANDGGESIKDDTSAILTDSAATIDAYESRKAPSTPGS